MTLEKVFRNAIRKAFRPASDSPSDYSSNPLLRSGKRQINPVLALLLVLACGSTAILLALIAGTYGLNRCQELYGTDASMRDSDSGMECYDGDGGIRPLVP